MAPFNPDIGRTADPNYIGLASNAQVRDSSAGSLFSGLGETLSAGIQASDAYVKHNVSARIEADVDRMRDDNIAETGAIATVLDSSAPLSILDPKIARVGNFKHAAEQGKLSDSEYYMRMESYVRQLRTEYPGYRDYIDQKIHGILGTTPANALRRSLQEDVERKLAKSASEETRFQTFVNSHAKYIYTAMPDYFNNPQKYNTPEGKQQIYREVARLQSAEFRMAAEGHAIDLAKKNREDVSERTRQLLASEANNKVGELIAGSIRTASGDLVNAEDYLNNLVNLPKNLLDMTPDKIQEATAMLPKLKLQLDAELEKLFNSPVSKDSKDTFRMLINDEAKLEAIKKGAMARFQSFWDAVFNKEYGLVGIHARDSEARKNHIYNTIMRNDDILPKMQVIREMLGGEAFQLLFFHPNGLLNQLTQAVNKQLNPQQRAATENAVLSSLSGQSRTIDKPSLEKYVDRNKTMGIDSPHATDALIQLHVNVLTNPKITHPDAIANVAEVLFSNDKDSTTRGFLARMDPKLRLGVYERLANPMVTRKLETLKDIKPEIWQNYVDWVKTGFIGLAREGIATAQEGVDDPRMDVTFDPKLLRFTAIPTNPTLFKEAKARYGYIPSLEKYTNEANRMMALVAPVLQANGEDPVAWLQEQFKGMGYTGKEDNRAPVVEALGNAIVKSLIPAGKEKAGSVVQSAKDAAAAGAAVPGAIVRGAKELANQPIFTGPDAKATEEFYRRNPPRMGGSGTAAPFAEENQPLQLQGLGLNAIQSALVKGRANMAVPGPVWGDPSDPSFVKNHITSIQTRNGTEVKVNTVAAQAFQGFLNELEDMGYKIDTIHGHSNRKIFGTNKLSQHAFGNALDINPTRNPVDGGHDLPENISEIAAKWGISWGGDWKRKKDYMHFEFTGINPRRGRP